MKKSIAFILVLIAVGAMTYFCSCSTHKGMVRCPENQKVHRTKQPKMVKCPKNQKVPRSIYLFNWQIK